METTPKVCEICKKTAMYHCPVDDLFFCKEHIVFHDSIQMFHEHTAIKNIALDLLKKSQDLKSLGETIKENNN